MRVVSTVYFGISAGGLNVAEQVVIERQTDSVCICYEGAKETYVGYVTLKVNRICGLI